MKKAALFASICNIERFYKSGIPIFNSEVSDRAGRKTRIRRRSNAIHTSIEVFVVNKYKVFKLVSILHSWNLFL